VGLLTVLALICCIFCIFRAYIARQDDDHLLLWVAIAVLFLFMAFVTYLDWQATGLFI
jgi:O-antigen ligase